jgi:5-methylcytosine-specific restriction endonuclease McrA
MGKAKTPRPYNDGKWTEAQMRGFIMGCLRRGHWPPKREVLNSQFVKRGPSPISGRACNLHKCECCGELFPKTNRQADHIEPVVPLNGRWGDATSFLGYNWNEVMMRMFVDSGKLQAISKDCHKAKTKQENQQRKAIKQERES